MKKRDLLIGLYLIISLILVCAEYTGDSFAVMLTYYSIMLLNLWNAVRLANKYIKLEEE
jgi:hypothetical protein